MTVKLSVINIIEKELDGNKETIPFKAINKYPIAFGKDNWDTVYYDKDTNRITIYLSAYHTAHNAENGEFLYRLSPSKMDVHIDYEGPDYYQDRLISFTPRPGNNNYKFVNTAVLMVGDTETKPKYIKVPYIGVEFSFDAQ